MIYDAEEVVTQFMVTMLKHRGSCYIVHDHDAETQRKSLHSPGPTMLKHKEAVT
jgi:hypothetical protein